MTYGPAELGDRQADARPYGDSSAEIEAERLRREAAVGGAPAQPRTPASRGPSPDAVDRNAGYMITPPQPDPTLTYPSGDFLRAQIEGGQAATRQFGDATVGADPADNDYGFGQPRIPVAAARRTPLLEQFRADNERRAQESDARRTDIWNQVLGFVDSLRNLPTNAELKQKAKDLQRRPDETGEQLKERSTQTLTDVAAPHADAAARGLGLVATPYTLVAQEAEIAMVQADPTLSAQMRDIVDSLPEDQQGVPSNRAAAAHAVLDATTARLLRALDDPNYSDDEKRAAFAVSSLLIIQRVAEFGGPQAARSIARLGIRGAAPRVTAAAGKDSDDVARLTSMSQRLRAIGANEDAAAVEAELTRASKQSEALAKASAEAKAASEPKAAPAAGEPGAPPSAEATTPSAKPSGQAEQGGVPPPAQRATPPATQGEPNIGINLDKIDAPDHVKELIRQEAMAHIDDITAQRRGVVPLEVTYAQARNLGIDVPSLAKIRAGTALNAEGFVSVFGAVVKTAKKRLALEEEIRAAGVLATPEQEARLLATMYDQNTLQRVMAGGRAETGRAMRAMRELSSGAQSGQIQDTFSRALDAIGGRKNMDKLLARLRDIQTHPGLDPLQREIAAIKFVGQLDRARFWDKINEVFINSILSNPQTHVGNVLGQTALMEADVISQFPAAVFDAAVSVGGLRRARTRTMQGAIVQAVAAHAASRRAAQEALLYMKTGVASEFVEKFRETGRLGPTQALQDVRIGGKNVAPIGTAINLPTRALGAEDVFFNRLGYSRQLHQDAANYVFRDSGENVFSRSSWRRVADILDHPDEFLIDGQSLAKRAEEAGRRAGLRQDAGELPELLTRIRDLEIPKTGGLAPLKFITPFVRIGFNLARVGAEYSPLGFFRVATTRGGTQADAFGRAVVGSSLWWWFWSKADAGELTGAAPTDANERTAFFDAGKRPYAIRVGDRWVEYGRYEPVATTLKWVYGMHDAWGDVQKGTQDPRLFGSALAKATGTMARSLTDSSYLSGLSDFFDIAQSSDSQLEQKLTRFAGNLGNSIAPYSGLRRFIAQRMDTTFRHPTDAWEQIEAANPGLSEMVRPYLTHWGEQAQRPDLTAGISTSREVVDAVDTELAKHRLPDTLDPDTGEVVSGSSLFVALAQQDIGNFGLTPDEGLMLQQVAGRATRSALAALFSDTARVNTGTAAKPVWKKYSELDEPQKVSEIQNAITHARSVSRATVADAILDSASTDGEFRRGIAMRLKTLTKAADRAEFLLGQQKQGHLTAAVRDYLNRTRANDAAIDEQLRAASLIPVYAALPKGDARRSKMLKDYPFLSHYVSGL